MARSNACREALSAKQQATELNHCKNQEEQRLEKARLAEEPAMSAVQGEKPKIEATVEAAEAAQRIAESESRRRSNLKTVEMKKMLDTIQ